MGPTYRTAHACFSCRVSFKLEARNEDDDSAVCPNCCGALFRMGRSFSAPAMDDAEQWKKVQALYAYGFRFFSYRSYPEAPPLPDKYKAVERFVADNAEHPFRTGSFDAALLPED